MELTSIALQDSVKEIGDEVFNGCNTLKKIKIPGSVRALAPTDFTCPISCRIFKLSERDWTSRGLMTSYSPSRDASHLVLKEKGRKLRDNTHCQDHQLGSFLCKNLSAITLPESVSAIHQFAFAYWSALSSINIRLSESIGHEAFFCPSTQSSNKRSASNTQDRHSVTVVVSVFNTTGSWSTVCECMIEDRYQTATSFLLQSFLNNREKRCLFGENEQCLELQMRGLMLGMRKINSKSAVVQEAPMNLSNCDLM